MKNSRFKPNTHFSHAYEQFTGERWQWEIDGERNDPTEADEVTRAFYIGFSLAKKGQEPLKQIKKEFRELSKELRLLENKLKKYER